MTNEAELFATLEKEMAHMPCESENHDRSPMHEGPGEWYVSYACPYCEFAAEPVLCCDRYKQMIPVAILLAGDNVVECRRCQSQFLYRQILVLATRRDM